MPRNKERITFTVEPGFANIRIDQCVTKHAEGEYSRVQVQKLIDAGKLTLNGKVCAAKRTMVAEGDEISFEPPSDSPMEHVEAEEIPLDVLYEDDALLVINKPAGMVVHPAAGNCTGTVVNALLGRDSDLVSEFGEEI